MAILAAVDITTVNTDTLIYTVPNDRVATVQINACNRSDQIAEVSIAMTPGIAPAAAHWIEFAHPLDPRCPLERTPQRMGAGERIYAKSSRTGVNFVITGETALPQE